MENDYEEYEPSYALLEEARKSWDYFTCDKIVHTLETINRARDPLLHVAEDYLRGNVWIEAHLILEGHRDTHYVVLSNADLGARNLGRVRKPKLSNETMNGDSPMLVDVTQHIEAPKQAAADGRGIRSVVRLKSFNNFDCICGRSGGVLLKPRDSALVVGVKNRELGSLRVGAAELRERPNNLIQGGAEAVQEVPSNEGNMIRDGRIFDLETNEPIFKVFLGSEGISLRLSESFKLRPQSIQVFLRPGCLQVGINQAWEK